MLSGQEKAKLLLSMLGDRATAVLSLVSPANAMLLTSTIEDSPKHSPAVLSGLVTEIMSRVSEIRLSAADMAPLGASIGEQTASAFSAFESIDDSADVGGFFGELPDHENDAEGESAPTGPKQRTPDEVASRLMREKPQIAAFLLSRFDDGLRDAVIDQMTYEFRDQIARIKVDRVPLSDAVFSKIYNQIVMDDGVNRVDGDEANSSGQTSSDTPSLFSFS